MKTRKGVLKHIQISNEDNAKLQQIKDAVGGVCESQAIRAAIRSFKVVK